MLFTCSYQLLVHFFGCEVYDGDNPCTGSVSTLSGVFVHSSYATIGFGAFCFGNYIFVGAGVGKLIGIFALRDVVILGGLLFTTSTILSDVYLWEDFYGFAFF